MCVYGSAQVRGGPKTGPEGGPDPGIRLPRTPERKCGIPYPTEFHEVCPETRGYGGHFGTSNTCLQESVQIVGVLLIKPCTEFMKNRALPV